MSDEEAQNDLVGFLKNVTIVGLDGSQRKMDDEQAQDFAAVLEGIGERAREERPRMDMVVHRLNEKIDGLFITGIGGNCPIQGSGTYKGEELYFRARGTHASLSVGSTDGEPPNSWNPRLYASARVTEEDDIYGAGWLTPEEVEIVIPILVENLEERTEEDNKARMDAFVAEVERIREQMQKDRDEQ